MKNIKDNKDNTANRSQLHTRLQYNFYWLLSNLIKIHYKQFEEVNKTKNAPLKGPGD